MRWSLQQLLRTQAVRALYHHQLLPTHHPQAPLLLHQQHPTPPPALHQDWSPHQGLGHWPHKSHLSRCACHHTSPTPLQHPLQVNDGTVDAPDVAIKGGGLRDPETEITAKSDTLYSSAHSFEELGLSPQLLQGLYTEMKFEKPSKIQAKTLPMILTPPYKSMIAQVRDRYNGVCVQSDPSDSVLVPFTIVSIWHIHSSTGAQWQWQNHVLCCVHAQPR